MALDHETWLLIALVLGGIFVLLALGGIVVLIVANKKKVDASPALPSVTRQPKEDVPVEVPFADTEFKTTNAAPTQPRVSTPAPLSRRDLRAQQNAPVTPRPTVAKSFFADDDDDDFDFTSGRD